MIVPHKADKPAPDTDNRLQESSRTVVIRKCPQGTPKRFPTQVSGNAREKSSEHARDERAYRESPHGNSGFDEARRVEAVEPAKARIAVGEVGGQCANIAIGSEDFVQTGDLVAADRNAA